MINGNENPTFSELVQKFEAKVKTAKLPTGSNFTFLLNSFTTIDEIRNKFEVLAAPFLNNSYIDQLYKKVPDAMKKNLLFHRKFKDVNWIQEIGIRNSCQVIYPLISFELFEICLSDFKFYDSYEQWIENVPVKKRLKKVQKDLSLMQFDYDLLNQQFNQKMAIADQLKASIEEDKATVIKLCDKLLNSANANEAKTILKELMPTLERIPPSECKLSDAISSHMKFILNGYNEHRKKWAEYIIGMRKTLESEPKTVEPMTKIQKFCVPLVYKCG